MSERRAIPKLMKQMHFLLLSLNYLAISLSGNITLNNLPKFMQDQKKK